MIPDGGRFSVFPSRVASNKQTPQQMTKEVVVPQDIPALDTEAFQLWADAMLRDGKIGRHRRVLILVSDTEGGHRASTEVGQLVTTVTTGTAVFTFAARP